MENIIEEYSEDNFIGIYDTYWNDKQKKERFQAANPRYQFQDQKTKERVEAAAQEMKKNFKWEFYDSIHKDIKLKENDQEEHKSQETGKI